MTRRSVLLRPTAAGVTSWKCGAVRCVVKSAIAQTTVMMDDAQSIITWQNVDNILIAGLSTHQHTDTQLKQRHLALGMAVL